MEKEIVRTRMDYNFFWEDVSIEDIRKDLIRMEKLGITHVSISSLDAVYYTCHQERLETDKELENRKWWAAKKAEIKKENELAELKRLKEKYENDK